MKNKRVIFCIFVLWVCFGIYGFAQDVADTEQATLGVGLAADAVDASRNIMLARSSLDYMVTPGDVYTLAYIVGGTPVTFIITVDTAYRIRVANLGVVNGRGRTFVQVRDEVEAIVARNFPLSGAQLVLTQPAVFRVFVNGEVYRAGETDAWGLSRLSSLVGGNLTRNASTRDITIRSANGQVQTFDLFRFWRFGDLSQNPHLRPGDVVTFNRVSRLVSLQGAVERPGTYQLQAGENIRELIELYGSGFSPLADTSRIEIVRRINSEDVSGNRIFLEINDCDEFDFVLEHYDIVNIPTTSDLMPVVFVEGAVGVDITAGLATTNRIVVQFFTGETYAAMVRRNRGWFSAVSDPENAYVVRRDGQIIPLNLNLALFDASYRGEVLVQDEDTLIIPFRQFFVTVAGAVVNPGRFPFIPDRDWEYYVGLAGGFTPGRNAFDRITKTDINGRRLGRTDPITPETTIVARTNHPLFFFNVIAPVVTTTVSIVLSILILSGN